MSEYTPSALAMLTEFFAADDIEHTARRTGFVKRASKITGKIFLALVTFGVWSDATTTLAQLAAKVTQLGEQLEVSPEALHQRMNKRALVFLQEMIRQALTKVQALEKVHIPSDLVVDSYHHTLRAAQPVISRGYPPRGRKTRHKIKPTISIG